MSRIGKNLLRCNLNSCRFATQARPTQIMTRQSPTDPAALPGEPPLSIAALFESVRELNPLRVISMSGPSVFEAICDLGPFSITETWLNAITESYHWHLQVDRVGHVRSRDQVHERSGRRVLFLELRERPEVEPFLFIYLHRKKGEEFGDERERRFAELHALLSAGIRMGKPS